MSNPFENAEGSHLALINDEGQCSRGAGAPRRAGRVDRGARPGRQAACMDHIDEHWVDLRPRSLVEQMSGQSS